MATNAQQNDIPAGNSWLVESDMSLAMGPKVNSIVFLSDETF